jgi:hypothetical protein
MEEKKKPSGAVHTYIHTYIQTFIHAYVGTYNIKNYSTSSNEDSVCM